MTTPAEVLAPVWLRIVAMACGVAFLMLAALAVWQGWSVALALAALLVVWLPMLLRGPDV